LPGIDVNRLVGAAVNREIGLPIPLEVQFANGDPPCNGCFENACFYPLPVHGDDAWLRDVDGYDLHSGIESVS
jgi:hypothetical protein